MINFIVGIDSSVTHAMTAIHCTFLDWLMKLITYTGNGGAIWIVLLCVLFLFKRSRRIALLAGFTLLFITILVNFGIKPIVNRERPYEVFAYLHLITGIPGGSSFPSGHTASAFAAAVPLMFYRKYIGIPALIYAGLIAFSRIYLYCHFLSDVVAAALIATLFALLFVFIYNKTIGKKYPLCPWPTDGGSR